MAEPFIAQKLLRAATVAIARCGTAPVTTLSKAIVVLLSKAKTRSVIASNVRRLATGNRCANRPPGARNMPEKIAAARARAEESLRTARIRLSQAGDEVAASARAAADAAHEYAREKPWKALAIAVGIGFLAGLLFERRRSDL